MSYEVLARKWRPQTFDEVVGQDHITKTLKKAVELGRISHAYLLSGPRGCGKTSTARILAKVINCSDLSGGNPCNSCSSCVEVMEGKNLDMMEIDGASHTGVAEVRDLQESIGYSPSQYKSKIYIIDEVHMLSNHAFNALLKTLEEPPSHVYFIFATTAPHKIPETIKSRCQRHHFKRMEIGEITGQLKKICDAEKIKYEKDALRLLARKAEGSMRDGESLLDQCVTASSGSVSTQAVGDILGLLDSEMVLSFLDRISQKEPSEVLRQLDRTIDEGVDLQELAGALLEGFRDMMILAAPGDLSDLLFRSKDEISTMKTIAASFDLPDLVTVVERMCSAMPRLKSAGDPRILLESVLVDITLLDRQTDIKDLIERFQSGAPIPGNRGSDGGGGHTGAGRGGAVKGAATTGREDASGKKKTMGMIKGAASVETEEAGRYPAQAEKAPGALASGSQDAASNGFSITATKPPEKSRAASPGLVSNDPSEQWKGFVTFVRQKKVSLGVSLISAKLVDFGTDLVQLEFSKGSSIQNEQVNNPESRKFLKNMLRKYFDRDIDISCSVAGEQKAAEEKAEEKEFDTNKFNSRFSIERQPVVKKIIEDFDGEIVSYYR
jgi:DNA polymerase-3 subunit gamma/tau